MSNLTTVAEMLGAPEYLIERSAQAKAGATGQTAEQIIASWAGGEPVEGPPEPPVDEETATEVSTASTTDTAPTEPGTPSEDSITSEPTSDQTQTPAEPPVVTPTTTTSPPAPTTTPAATETLAPPTATPAVTATTTPAGVSSPMATATPATPPGWEQPAVSQEPAPPVLVGVTDRPFLVWWGGMLLVALGILFGFVLPAFPEDPPGIQTSRVWLGGAVEDGKRIYLEQGCGACHTQLVRPLVADTGLGPVTVADTNQVLGIRRIGPDLAHVGSRYPDPQALIEILSGREQNHHSYAGLGDQALSDLVAYLSESR